MESFIYQGKPKGILRVLCERYPQLGYNTINKLLRNKDVKVDGVRVDSKFLLRGGENVAVYITDLKRFKLVYEDENIVIVDKNIGVEVEGEDSLVESLKKEYLSVRAVHRIDRNTKGLVVLALNDPAEAALLDAFKRRLVAKYYLAEVFTIPRIKCATLRAYLLKDAKNSLVKIYDLPQSAAREIITEYRVLSEREDSATLEVKLVTGATHQIRAHLAYAGFPIIGDNKYGNSAENKRRGKRFQQLVAYKIVFNLEDGLLKYLNGVEFLAHDFKLK